MNKSQLANELREKRNKLKEDYGIFACTAFTEEELDMIKIVCMCCDITNLESRAEPRDKGGIVFKSMNDDQFIECQKCKRICCDKCSINNLCSYCTLIDNRCCCISYEEEQKEIAKKRKLEKWRICKRCNRDLSGKYYQTNRHKICNDCKNNVK